MQFHVAMRTVAALVAIAAAFSIGPRTASASDEGPSYARDVRPVLSARCFQCHGPDDESRQSGLRLDERDAATSPADSGRCAIVPGDIAGSELIRRIESSDESERMPPPESNHALTPQQIDALKQWIAAGAKYEPHWAFAAPIQRVPPAVRNTDWPQTPIDRFVLAELERQGLKPSPEADRYTLIRRVHLDLIGIPPTPDEADRFVNDASPDAYERVVDRLLASPHYGERWARRWLDLARYADTNGYQIDYPRSIWPYRDWVINALNAGMPFDRFTIEQIAGDMLPNATESQRVATGFHRNTMINEEGGIDPLEFRYYAMVDRVNTTASVWLGLTLGCAQCHAHKFDPIQHEEYYEMMAWLNNVDEPMLAVHDPDIAARRGKLRSRITALTNKLPERFPTTVARTEQLAASLGPGAAEVRSEHAKLAFAEWLAARHEDATPWRVLRPAKMTTNLPKLYLLDDGSILAGGDQTKSDRYELDCPVDLASITAVRLEVLPHESLPGNGPGRVHYGRVAGDEIGDFFLSEFELSVDGRAVALVDASDSVSASGAGENSLAALAIDGVSHSGWSVNAAVGSAQQAVFRLEEPIADAESLHVSMSFETFHSAGLGRFRLWVTDDKGRPTAKALPADLEELTRIAPDQLTAQQRDRLWRWFLGTAPELAAAQAEIDQLENQMPAFPTTLVMQERPRDNPRPTFRRHRGEFLLASEQVSPDTLSVLHRLPDGAPRDRLAFARWLVDPENPLVGRVAMNRQWAALFGAGIVRSTADFGHQGAPPTHPELLDWMAVEFVRQGWSMKAMHRLMVTSAVYRQSAEADALRREVDADNRLLSRGPRVRLEAELIRDQALAAAGLLTRSIGGPSVFPPQPASVANEGNMAADARFAWTVSVGDDRYRRGLYTFSKRTAPFAMFQTFDAPAGTTCVARRELSNSPLQALTLLNDEVFLEAAQFLGRQAADRAGGVRQRARWLFRRCLIRPPTAEELSALVDFFAVQREQFLADQSNARKLAAVDNVAEGQSATAAEHNDAIAEAAAWIATARALLNLDEMMTKE